MKGGKVSTVIVRGGRLPDGDTEIPKYVPRVILARYPRAPDNRTAEEKLASLRACWVQNDRFFGDSLDFFGPRP